ncbi:MAG: sugar O-acetyltransferase [Clostridiales bacterium]|nr:sugar O-acetyltransferase [Clostridiales bacterium]
MTEKEKMLAGKLYHAGDELAKELRRTKCKIHEINNMHPDQIQPREKAFRELFHSIGGNFNIESPFFCDYGENITIGENFYANHNCIILDCAKVTIGDNVLFGPSVSVFTAGHPVDTDLRLKGLEYAFPITIGNNVWIGGGTIINPGITIGDGAVIGAGSIVTKDIPPNVIAVGNPCKVLREINEDDKVRYFKDRTV